MSQVKPARKLRVRVGPRTAGILMTPEEFDDLSCAQCVPGYRYELINGVLVVSPATQPAERGPNEELGFLLRLYQTTDPHGAALDDTLPEHDVLSTPNRRRCDRAIWCSLGRQPRETEDLPTIVVEFVSSGKRGFHRDYVAKRDEYRACGIVEYWIFDRFRRCLMALRFPNDRVEEILVAEGGVYQTELLPGFVLPVSRILARADAWPTKKRRRPRAGDSE